MAKTIFLAHANAQQVEELTTLFKSSGFSVVSAANGQEAYDKLSQVSMPPDLAILGAQLAEMPAVDLCKQISSNAKFKSLKILVLMPEEMDSAPLQAAGANDFIDEPFDPNRLLRKINVLLSYGGSATTGGKKFPLIPLIVIGLVILIFVIFMIRIMPQR